MKITDAHAHLMAEPGYVDNLLKAMDACGIEQTCLNGLGPVFAMQDNDAVHEAFRAHPDRIIGAYFIRPGVDEPGRIVRARELGFRMLKVTIPRGPYDAPEFVPLWAAAVEQRMPILFHTGIVNVEKEHGAGVSSWHMHPMRVEPIVNAFPELPVILAHLGVCWNLEAAELARMRPNVYVDVTGASGGWRDRARAIGLDHWLWWPGAFKKIIFGTDVRYDEIHNILNEDRADHARLGIDEETVAGILGGTMQRLLDAAIT